MKNGHLCMVETKKKRILGANIPCEKSVDNVQNWKTKKYQNKHVI